MILEVNDAGQLILPAELVQAPPHTCLEAGREGETVVLKPIAGSAERPSILSLPTFPAGPVNPAMTFRREDIYDDDGR
jgi:hypothetical protein